MGNVVIVAACRTAVGSLGGMYKTITSLDLSIPVMQELIKRSGIDPTIIEDVIWGCNYQRTYKENNLARVAAVKAGLPESVPGITIHRNCTSSLSSIQFGFYQIKAGEADCIMAGGADSMSTAPHMVFDARYGKKYGHMEMRDSMWDSFTNLGVGPAMGITAENVAEKYGITEEDFISAELEIVPAMKARFVGFDKTLIAAYGHDDKICGYTSMTALAELKAPEKTCVLILADKEEIGSIGNTGMESDMLRNFTAFLCEPHGVMPEMVYVNSKCLSADVSAAFDPTFPMVHERMNAPYLNRGPAVSKYLGSGGKGGSNDAHAEYVGDLRRMWDEAGVPWQLTELGKLDEGGGGTVAKFISRLGIDTIDIGVPLLSMHSPYELAASLDLYSMDRAVSAFFRNM